MPSSRRLPRSVQISEALIREISSGILTDGTRLPTEKHMAATYDVAVGTLRKSLSILEAQGLLERVQGSGNYIRSKQEITSIYKFFRLELLKGGGLPSAKILDIQTLRKEPNFPQFGNSKSAYRIDRLRFLDERLIALEQIWLDGRFAKDMHISDVSDSLYEYYKSALNLVMSRIEDKVSFQPVPEGSPPEFNMPRGAMAGYIERIAWDQFDQPAEFSKTWFNPNICHYVNRT
ncbi:MAG: GntR family transcriptional regulator [Litorimonas sp.]